MDERVARLISNREPEFHGEVTNEELRAAYNWYSQNREKKDASMWLDSYCRDYQIPTKPELISKQVSTLGFTARMIARGLTPSPSLLGWFNTHLHTLQIIQPTKENCVIPPPKKTIQTYIQQQVSMTLAELNALVDEYILSGFNGEPSPTSIFTKHQLNGVHAPLIVKCYQKQSDEIKHALERSDTDLTEAYAHFTRSQLKKLQALFDLIIHDALTLLTISLQSRAPRKRKVKSPLQLTAKLKYLSGDTTLTLTSIAPNKFIGSLTLWVYNIKTRKLGCYYAKDADGLSVKGQTIVNYIEKDSTQKIIRHPERLSQEFMPMTRSVRKKFYLNIKAKQQILSGLINKETLLLAI